MSIEAIHASMAGPTVGMGAPSEHEQRMRRRSRALYVTRLAVAALACLGAAGCGKSKSSADPVGGGNPDPGGGPIGAPSQLAYSDGSLFLVLGSPLAPIEPSVEGQATSFHVDPPLPAGLSLDPSTGVLSGTPGERIPRRTFRLSASNASGSALFDLDIQIVGPSRFAYVANSDDATISIYAVDDASGRLHFHGYHPQASGELGPGPLLVHPEGVALYVANQASDTLSAHRLSPATGRVSQSDALPVGVGPHALALHPAASHLYLCSEGESTLRTYAVAPATGALTEVGEPVATGASPSHVLADPMGRYIALVHRDTGQLSILLLDSETGVPAPADTAPLGPGVATGAVLAPSGRDVYVTMQGVDRVVHLRVDPADGALQAGSSYATGSSPTTPAIHPTGKHVFVPTPSTGSLLRFARNASTGALTPQGNAAVSAGSSRVDFDSTGAFAYSLDPESRELTLHLYDGESGALESRERRRTRQGPTTLAFASGDEPVKVQATHLYVANRGSGNVSTFAIDPNSGTLATRPPTIAGNGPVDVALDPLGRYAFVVCAIDREILTFSILSDGGLAPLGLPFPLAGEPGALTVDPSGRFLFVTDLTAREVVMLGISGESDSDGQLDLMGARQVGEHPIEVQVDPTGQFLYVVNREGGSGTGSVSQFAIHPQTGDLSPMQDAVSIARPTSLCFSPVADRAYSTLSVGHIIVPYQLSAAQGMLDYVPPGTRALNLPVDVDISVSGRFAYTAMFDPNSWGGVLVFDVRAADGALWNEQTGHLAPTGHAFTGLNPFALVSSPDERFLYVLNQGSNSLTTLGIDIASGQLLSLQDRSTGLFPRALEMAVRVQ